jgi:hypothetical protein
MPLRFTPSMKKRLTQRAHFMLRSALQHFPELLGKTITVGYTRAHLGSAIVPRHAETELTIRVKVRKLTYNTIGHELTHLVQGLSQLQPAHEQLVFAGQIPGGEKQCDIWTLARSELFCDDAPTYLKLPREVRENWRRYASAVRALCVQAIEKRQTYRLYIRWLEDQIQQLAQQPVEKYDHGMQLCLSLDSSS